MGRYKRRYYRTPKNPLRDISITIGTIAVFILCFGLLQLQSFLNRLFSSIAKPLAGATALGNVFFVVALAAILIGGGGLVLLGITWVSTRRNRSTIAPTPVPSKNPPVTSPTPSNQPAAAVTPSELQIPSDKPVAVSSEPSPQPPLGHNSSVLLAPSSPPTPTIELPQPRLIESPPSFPVGEHQPQPTLANGVTVEFGTDTWENDNAVEAKCILTNQERAFFWLIFKAVKNRYYIFPQILLREFVSIEKYRLPRELQRMWQDGIADFVLADVNTMEIVAVAELDDPSHQQADVQARDRRKNQILELARIPLIRFSTRQIWSAASIQQSIVEAIATQPARRSFMSTEQARLFCSLREVWEQAFIFPKVSLKQAIHRANWLPLNTYKTLQDESIDFLMAHPRYLGTRMVIEMGDRSLRHSAKIDLLSQARIPWLIVDDAGADKVQLREKMRQKLAS